jgi:hypothetical protein
MMCTRSALVRAVSVVGKLTLQGGVRACTTAATLTSAKRHAGGGCAQSNHRAPSRVAGVRAAIRAASTTASGTTSLATPGWAGEWGEMACGGGGGQGGEGERGSGGTEQGWRHTATLAPNRGVIELRGVDTLKLLQGLVTNNVFPLGVQGDGGVSSLYTLFLTAQGRALYDTFLYRA